MRWVNQRGLIKDRGRALLTVTDKSKTKNITFDEDPLFEPFSMSSGGKKDEKKVLYVRI